jgi:hypothetical protein
VLYKLGYHLKEKRLLNRIEFGICDTQTPERHNASKRQRKRVDLSNLVFGLMVQPVL